MEKWWWKRKWFANSWALPEIRTEKEGEERVKRQALPWTSGRGEATSSYRKETELRGGKQFTWTGTLGEVMQEFDDAALT